MKKLFIVQALILTFGWVSGQNVIDSFFDKYNDDPEITAVSINGTMIGFAKLFAEKGDEKEVLDGMEGIKIIEREAKNKEDKFLCQEIRDKLKGAGYVVVMNVREGSDHVDFYAKGNGKIFEDLVIVAEDDLEESVIYLKGKIDPEKIAAHM